MASVRKQLRIIPLGEIVTINEAKTMSAFAKKIAEKKNVDVKEILPLVGKVLQENMQILELFKQGEDEKKFTDNMIAALKNETEVTLTTEEFDEAWNAMNPTFDEFKNLLESASDYHAHDNQEVIFISNTNPKDMRHLAKELNDHHQTTILRNDELYSINGIQLISTYICKMPVVHLIEDLIKSKLEVKAPQSSLASSMNTYLSSISTTPPEIKYIRSENQIKHPLLKKQLDDKNQIIDAKIKELGAELIVWTKLDKSEKKDQGLSDILNDQIAKQQNIVYYN